MITKIGNAAQKHTRIHTLINQFSTKSLVILSVHVLFLVIIMWMDSLDYRAKISLFAFLSAMTLWIATKLSAGLVAVALLIFTILMNAGDPDLLYHSLADEVVWLMIGSFIIGEAVKQSGLAERFSRRLTGATNNKSRVLIGMSSVLFASAFFIPSTSGRAALILPIIKQIHHKFSAKEQNVLAIMAPVVILMSTSATLVGAGSHIIGLGFLGNTADRSISYIQWLIWGAPFAFVVSAAALIVIKLMLWPKDAAKEFSSARTEVTSRLKMPMNEKEKKTLILLAIMSIGWVTESIHGYDIAFVTMTGAVLVMLPNYGIISWKGGIDSISWNLIVFVAAAAALGKMIVDTGVVNWVEKETLGLLHLLANAPEWLIVLVILLVTVTSHLYITSHTTRAVVFIPSLLVFSEAIGVNPSAVVFLGLIGMNYCVTFPVSSKALLLFYEEGEISYNAKHLIKISTILMPLYILVIVLFYFTYWRWTGLYL